MSQSGPTDDQMSSLLEEFTVEQIQKFCSIKIENNDTTEPKLEQFENIRFSKFKMMTDKWNKAAYHKVNLSIADYYARSSIIRFDPIASDPLPITYVHQREVNGEENKEMKVEKSEQETKKNQKKRTCCFLL